MLLESYSAAFFPKLCVCECAAFLIHICRASAQANRRALDGVGGAILVKSRKRIASQPAQIVRHFCDFVRKTVGEIFQIFIIDECQLLNVFAESKYNCASLPEQPIANCAKISTLLKLNKLLKAFVNEKKSSKSVKKIYLKKL